MEISDSDTENGGGKYAECGSRSDDRGRCACGHFIIDLCRNLMVQIYRQKDQYRAALQYPGGT